LIASHGSIRLSGQVVEGSTQRAGDPGSRFTVETASVVRGGGRLDGVPHRRLDGLDEIIRHDRGDTIVGGGQEHAVGDVARTGDDGAEPQARREERLLPCPIWYVTPL